MTTRPADIFLVISQTEIDRRLASVFELLFEDVIEDALRYTQTLDMEIEGEAILAGEQNDNGERVSDAASQ